MVTAIQLTSHGTNYTSTPTVILSGGGGTGAGATAILTEITDADLPPDRQPERMTCAKARRDAQRTGGWVIWAQGPESFRSGTVAAEDFGPHGLHGVPPDRLPPPGWCRLWFEGTPPDRQPPAGPCAEVARRRGSEGGRLLYMPASDLRG